MNAIHTLLTDHLAIWTDADTEKKSGRGRGAANAANVYGIRKLRELIFGLAISGRLLPQDSKDVPTSDVAKKIGIKKKILNEALLNEFLIPASWEWHYISDLCDLKTGATPSTAKADYYGGQIRWLVSGDINKNEIYDCEGRITEAGLNNSNCKILPKNSVLIALNGQGKTRATVAILRVEAACNQSLVAMIPKFQTLILPEFILINLRYRYFEIRDITGQNQRRGLNMGLVGELSISVPPLAEQRRIVAKVDELMGLCDQLESRHNNAAEAHEKLLSHLLSTLTQSLHAADFSANWQRIAAHFDTLVTTEASIDALKQTLLQLAVMGKLVPQDPNDEPASELLKCIQAEKTKLIAEGKVREAKPLDLIADEEKPFELPEGWQWVKCQDVCLKITDGEHATPRRSESGRYLLSARNVTNEGIILDDVDYVPLDEFERIRSRCDPNIGDILISCSGSVGRVALVDKDNAYSMVRSAAMIRPNNNWLCNEYLVLLLRSVYLQDQMKKRSKQSAQANLFLGAISNLVLIIPPLAEQHRIVAKVDELMALCDQLKTRLNAANQLQQKLADVVVKQAVA